MKGNVKCSSRVGKNNIGAPKMQNKNNSASKMFINLALKVEL